MDYLSLIIGIIGVILAVLFYLKSRVVKSITYDVVSFSLINDELQGVKKFQASYDGESLESLTATKLTVFNSGNQTLEMSDFASTRPLEVSFHRDSKIFDVEVVYFSTKENRVTVSKDGYKVKIAFEYLSPKEGFLIKTLHTAANKEVELDGTIKGNGVIKKVAENLSLYGHVASLAGFASTIGVVVIYEQVKQNVNLFEIALIVTAAMLLYLLFIGIFTLLKPKTVSDIKLDKAFKSDSKIYDNPE